MDHFDSVYYRKLNDVKTKNSYPLPRIDDTLTILSESTWFSTLDLMSAYLLRILPAAVYTSWAPSKST